MIDLLRISNEELEMLIQAITVETSGAGVPSGPEFRAFSNSKVSNRRVMFYDGSQIVTGPGPTTVQILGPNPAVGANFNEKPFYLGYIDHALTVNPAHTTGEQFQIAAFVGGSTGLGVLGTRRLWMKEISIFTDVTGETTILNENLPRPVLFQTWQVILSAALGVNYNFAFKGIQIFTN